MLTHTAPTGAYRGAGRPEAIYMIERLMDAAARATGIDQVELRRRNMIQPGADAVPESAGQDLRQRAVRVGDGPGARARRHGRASRRGEADAKRRGRLRGRGMAAFLEWTGADVFEETVTVTVDGDGDIEIVSATQAMGQGLATTYAQLAVDVFGVPIEKIRIVQGDTDRATGFGSAGSRSLFVGGSAVKVAAERTVAKAQDLAAQALEAAAGDIEYRGRRRSPSPAPTGASIFSSLRDDSRSDASDSSRRAPSPTRRGRTPATSARSRSTPTPAPSKSRATGR